MKLCKLFQLAMLGLTFSILIAGVAHAQLEESESFEIPELSGSEQTYDSARFRIHYTLSGIDAVPAADADGNSTPDYVELVARVLEEVHDIEVGQFGWVAPPPDNGLGGNDLYDVYLLELLGEGVAGFVDGGFDETIVGDNPNSPDVTEINASFSFMALDNDYDEAEEFEATVSAEGLLRSTAAHEYTHSLQMGYDSLEPLEWLWESTATWMQDEVYDDVDDANSIIADYIGTPSACQFDADPYGMWIFLRYISEQFGRDIIRTFWENTVALDGYSVVETALSQAGTTLDDVLRGFAVSVLTRDFEEGRNYPTLQLEATATGTSFSPEAGVAQVAYDFVALQLNGVTTIGLDNSALVGMVVGIRNEQAEVFNMENGQATVDAAAFDHLYLVVINPERVESQDACQATDYSVTFSLGDQADTPSEQHDAANFVPPQVGEFELEVFGEGGFPIEAPNHLIPGYLPPGFELVEAFEDDFEGEPVIVVVFENEAGDFVEVMAHQQPYANLDEWLQEIDYEPSPEELITVEGVQVLLEDWSEPGDIYFNATFVQNGQLIELGSNLPTEEITRIVASLLGQGLPEVETGFEDEPGQRIDLIPDYLPDGFVLEDLFKQGDATVVLFGDGDDFIQIVAEPSPYDTLFQYLDAIDFNPNQGTLLQIEGVNVVVELLEGDGELIQAASFILDGQLIEVSGTVSEEELLQVVESLLS